MCVIISVRQILTCVFFVFKFPSVPVEKLKTHDNESDKKNETTTPSRKKPKTKPAPPQMQEYYFKDFRKLCMLLSQENSYLQKTAIIKDFFDKILAKGTLNIF